MAFYTKVRCDNCRGNFTVYQKQMVSDVPAKCPFCNTSIQEKLWRGFVECFQGVVNWNKEAEKEAAENGAPLFTVEIRRHYVPNERIVMEE